MKNWRSRKIEKASISSGGTIRGSGVPTHPRWANITYRGMTVAWPGRIIAAITSRKMGRRPGKRRVPSA
jgi:hypothetical protein